MLYRIAHAINASYGLVVAWVYIIAFGLAFMLLFIFPQITLLMLFLGLASLGVTITFSWVIDGFTRRLARKAIGAGRCPRCGAPSSQPLVAGQRWMCERCGGEFDAEGAEAERSQGERPGGSD